jgi:lambda family phage portal protein
MGFFRFLKEVLQTSPRPVPQSRAACFGYEDSYPKAVRAYTGAKRGRLHGDWQALGSSANTEVYGGLVTLRNRSRDLCRNDDYARGIIRNIIKNVVYVGIGFQANCKQVKDSKVNDGRVNNLIEDGFKYWSKKNYCDVTGQSSFAELQQLAFKSYLESGEVFIRKIKRSFGECKIPFALEIIEADQVAEDYNTTAPNGNQIVMGIELDAWKRPVAYWISENHPGDFWYGGRTGPSRFVYESSYTKADGGTRNLRRIAASEIIHLYQKERPGQLRGVPVLYSTINRLRNLHKYEEAELVAARAAANFMGIVTSPFNDLLAEPEDEPDKPTEETLTPGIIKYLAEGEDFKSFTPNRPNSAFEGFHRNQLRAAAVGVGLAFEGASGDYSQSNYSSSRLSLLDVRDVWVMMQQSFITNFLVDVYESWLEQAVLGGYFNFGDYEIRPERYQAVRWTARGWTWVDPAKEIKATIDAIKSGLTTVTEQVAKQGGDFEENVKAIAREREICKQYNVSLVFDGQEIHEVGNSEDSNS